MNIEYTQRFTKHFKKRLSPTQQEKFYDRLVLFKANAFHPLLRDHKLTGAKKHLRSFWVTGDIRAIYERKGHTILFVDVGTHSQVY